MRFLPLRRFPGIGQPHNSWREPPLQVKVPSQRFSRSQGFDPPGTCRPCFMPVPSLGFPFRGSFHPQSCLLSRAPYPLVVGRSCHFRVLLPASVLAPRQLCRLKRAAPLLGFTSLGISPSLLAIQRIHPLWSFSTGRRAAPVDALQSFGPAKKSAWLSRACHPLRGLPPRQRPGNEP
jgi:hypothetical protein